MKIAKGLAGKMVHVDGELRCIQCRRPITEWKLLPAFELSIERRCESEHGITYRTVNPEIGECRMLCPCGAAALVNSTIQWSPEARVQGEIPTIEIVIPTAEVEE